MQLFNTTPNESKDTLNALYARMPEDGLVQSSLMHGHRFDIAEDYNEDWSCASITWSVGGEEEYRFREGDVINVRSAGALTLAQGARYAYHAKSDAPFRSSMITFPHWITGAAEADALTHMKDGRRLETRLFLPTPEIQGLMNDIALRCRSDDRTNDWYAEKCALLYEKLLAAQDHRAAARDQINAVKPGTRQELARRANLAREVMLQRFYEPRLSLQDIAREACLSPYHLIRIFKQVAGATPMQFLSAIRMEAAQRLLRETKMAGRDVAAAVGYSDRTAFYKAFRTYYG
ncbi:MAG: helix-turn-helix transcriptional regulator, partial [Pseudomonadota bacterium]